MIIAIPLNEQSLEAGICQSFGRAPCFLIYDSEHKKNHFLVNEAVESRDGAGVRASQTIVDQRVDVLLTPRCGANAASILKAAQVSIYRTMGDSVQANLDAFRRGELVQIKQAEVGRGGYGRK